MRLLSAKPSLHIPGANPLSSWCIFFNALLDFRCEVFLHLCSKGMLPDIHASFSLFIWYKVSLVSKADLGSFFSVFSGMVVQERNSLSCKVWWHLHMKSLGLVFGNRLESGPRTRPTEPEPLFGGEAAFLERPPREPRTRLGGWRDGRGRRGGRWRGRWRRGGLDLGLHLWHLNLLLLLLGQAVDELLVLRLQGLDLLLEGELHRLDHRGVLIDECRLAGRAESGRHSGRTPRGLLPIPPLLEPLREQALESPGSSEQYSLDKHRASHSSPKLVTRMLDSARFGSPC